MYKVVDTYEGLFSEEICWYLDKIKTQYNAFIIKAYKLKETGDYIHWEFVLKGIFKTYIVPLVMKRKYCEKALEKLKDLRECLVFEDENRLFNDFFGE